MEEIFTKVNANPKSSEISQMIDEHDCFEGENTARVAAWFSNRRTKFKKSGNLVPKSGGANSATSSSVSASPSPALSAVQSLEVPMTDGDQPDITQNHAEVPPLDAKSEGAVGNQDTSAA